MKKAWKGGAEKGLGRSGRISAHLVGNYGRRGHWAFDCSLVALVVRGTYPDACDAPFVENRIAAASLIANAIVDLLRWCDRFCVLARNPCQFASKK